MVALKGCVIVLSGTFTETHAKIKALVKRNGGKVGSKIDHNVTHLVATAESAASDASKTKLVVEFPNIKLVTYAWLRESVNNKAKADESDFKITEQPIRSDNGARKRRRSETPINETDLLPGLRSPQHKRQVINEKPIENHSTGQKRPRHDGFSTRIDPATDSDSPQLERQKIDEQPIEIDDRSRKQLPNQNQVNLINISCRSKSPQLQGQEVEFQTQSRPPRPPVDDMWDVPGYRVYIGDDGTSYDAEMYQEWIDSNFARIQLLQAFPAGIYKVLVRSGKFDTVGDVAVFGDGSFTSAMDFFHAKFWEKTRLKWNRRLDQTPVPAWVPIETDAKIDYQKEKAERARIKAQESMHDEQDHSSRIDRTLQQNAATRAKALETEKQLKQAVADASKSRNKKKIDEALAEHEKWKKHWEREQEVMDERLQEAENEAEATQTITDRMRLDKEYGERIENATSRREVEELENERELARRDEFTPSDRARFQLRGQPTFELRHAYIPNFVYFNHKYEGDSSEEKDGYSQSILSQSTQEMMYLIFNQGYFLECLNATKMDYDTNKLPLGELTKDMWAKGFHALENLKELLMDLSSKQQYDTTYREAVTTAFNFYYDVIPHKTRGFLGWSELHKPLLPWMDKLGPNDPEIKLQEELPLMGFLNGIVIANAIMKEAAQGPSMSVLDRQFAGLGLREMNSHRCSAEFRSIQSYLTNRQVTPRALQVTSVVDIFRIERSGEEDLFEGSACAGSEGSDRRLLWHAASLTNLAAILSEGLQPAYRADPPRSYTMVPKEEFISPNFKAFHFADMIPKVAATCHPHPQFNTGLLLLYEVDLGRPMLELTSDHFETVYRGEDNNPSRNRPWRHISNTWKGPDSTMSPEEQKSTVFWKTPGPAVLARQQGCTATIHKGYNTPENWVDASCINQTLTGVLMPDMRKPPVTANPYGAPEDKPNAPRYNASFAMLVEYSVFDRSYVTLRYLLRVVLDEYPPKKAPSQPLIESVRKLDIKWRSDAVSDDEGEDERGIERAQRPEDEEEEQEEFEVTEHEHRMDPYQFQFPGRGRRKQKRRKIRTRTAVIDTRGGPGDLTSGIHGEGGWFGDFRDIHQPTPGDGLHGK